MENAWNFVAFQIGWFANVISAGRGSPWLGPAITLPLLILHLTTISEWHREAAFLLTVLTIGMAVDFYEERRGWLRYGRTGRLAQWLPPLWIAALWLLFATTFHRSLAWLTDMPWLAVPLGAVGSPLSYLAGARFGALSIGAEQRKCLLRLGMTWAVALPLIAWLASLSFFSPSMS